MSISDKEREIFVSILAGACMGKIALVESTEKATGKRVLALCVPNAERPEDAVVHALVSVEDLAPTVEPLEGGETIGTSLPPVLAPILAERAMRDCAEGKKPLMH